MSQRSFYSLAAIVVIFFISYAYIHLDLPTGDESGYLFHGLSQSLSLGWAPLYGEWYRFLNFFIINLVDLYRVNYVITTLAPTITLLAYLRLRSIPILYQLCALLLALSIWGSPNVVSRSGHLAIAIILLRTIQCEIQNKKSLVGNSINALMFYLVSFLRGDLFIGYLWYLGKISFEFLTKKTSISIRCSTFAMVGVLILPLVFRLTPFHDSTLHSFIALKQLIAANLCSTFNIQADPMLDFDLLLKTNEHQSITTFLMSRFDNVFLLLWHLWKNTDSLPHFIFITISGIQLSWLTGIGSALVVLCSMFMIKKEFYFKDSPLTVAAIISFTMSIVYMPQLHYAHALIVVIIIFLLTQKMTNNLIPIVISCIALIRFVTVFTQFPSAQPYKDTVSMLNSVQLTSPIHILESDNVYAAYLPTLTVSRVAYRITQPLCEYISDYSINVIMLNNNFITKSGFSRKEIDELNQLNSCGYHWQSLMTPMGNVLIRLSPAKL